MKICSALKKVKKRKGQQKKKRPHDSETFKVSKQEIVIETH